MAYLLIGGEMALFDRSWYKRTGMERVMGFYTKTQYDKFIRQTPLFEKMLVNSGMTVIEFWFSVTQAERRTSFIFRQVDLVR